MTYSARYPIALLCCLFLHRGIVRGNFSAPTTLRFAVTVAAGLGPDRAFPGRLLVVLGRTGRWRAQARYRSDWMGISEQAMMQQMWSRLQAAGDTL